MNPKFYSNFKTSIGVLMISSSFFIGNLNTAYCNTISVENVSFQKIVPKPIFQNKIGTFYEDLSSYDISVENFNSNLVSWFTLNEKHSFVKVREFTDDLGIKHESFQHIYNGLKVENDLVFVHSKSGKLQSVNGQLVQFTTAITSHNLSDEAVLEAALSEFGQFNGYKKSEVETILSKIQNEKGLDIIVVKKIKLISLKPAKSIFYFIDADGKIVKKINEIKNADVSGVGTTYYHGVQNFTVDSFNGQYRLKDNFRNITTFNAINIDINPITFQIIDAQHYLSSTSSFSTVSSRPAVEVHWAMSKTYDYFKNKHNRLSYDGLGSPINNYYNYPEDFASTSNAFAFDNEGFFVAMFFGKGGPLFNPFVGIDVAGHEFSHLVIGRNGNGGLDYVGESGALNESFADIFGTAIEFYANSNPNWTIGEGIIKPPVFPTYLRNMANPNEVSDFLDGQPDTYQGEFWVNTTDIENDHGGVHKNSGVGNFWFYLLSDLNNHAGTNDIGNQYFVQGIGINKAEKIVYKALMEGLTPSATYLDAFNATKQAAIALFGNESNEFYQVVNAWYAVGIGNSAVGIDKNELKINFTIYPNPTINGIFTIDSQSQEKVTVQIYDLLGKQVGSTYNIEKGTNQIDISDLSNGIYQLFFKAKGKSYTSKIIKN